MENMTQTDVLVVGAGPTGLTLACDLARRGVAVRIIDQAPQFPSGSRGKGLSPRSLEVLDDLGVIDRIQASGHRWVHPLSKSWARDLPWPGRTGPVHPRARPRPRG